MCPLAQGIWHQRGALKSFLWFRVHRTHAMRTLLPRLRHAAAQQHTHTSGALQGGRISHGLPGAHLRRSECIATGNLTHHSTRGISASAASPCSQALAAPNLLSGTETAPNAQSSYDCQRQLQWLFRSSSCFNSSCWTGAKLSSSVMVSGVWVKVLYNQT